MKKVLWGASVFGLAVVLGVGVAILSPSPGFAYYCGDQCAVQSFHYTFGESCTCSGRTGVYVTKWWGYDSVGGDCCIVRTFCSACPPSGEGKLWPCEAPC